MGPILAAQEQARRARSRRGKKPPGSTLAGLLRHGDRPRAPLPGLRPADRLQGRDGREQARRQGDRRVHATRSATTSSRGTRSSGPGAEVRARVDCGEARLAYVLLRDVVHVFYETVLFRWPFLQLNRPVTRRPPSRPLVPTDLTTATRRPARRPLAPETPPCSSRRKPPRWPPASLAALVRRDLGPGRRAGRAAADAPRRSSSTSGHGRLDREVRRRRPAARASSRRSSSRSACRSTRAGRSATSTTRSPS